MSLGVIVRADQSGLAQLTERVVEKLHPDRILVVDLGMHNRGPFYPHRYHDKASRVFTVQHPNGWNVAQTGAFLAGLTHVWSAETFYAPGFPNECVAYGATRHLYVMPELFNLYAPELKADRYWLPCAIGPEHAAHPRARILPWWTTTDTDTPKLLDSDGPLRLVHPTGTAMADRNGTRALLAACAHMHCEAIITIVGSHQEFGDPDMHIGPVTIRRIPRVDHWRSLYEYGDVLVLPRRYGWLSLPMYEAATFGMPVVTTQIWPQSEWFAEWPELLVRPVGPPMSVRMKGGDVLVYTADPTDLAAALDWLACNPADVERIGAEFRRWAEDHDWTTVRADWKSALT